MHLKINRSTRTLGLITIVALFICPFVSQAFSVQLTATSEYTTYVHTYISSQSNYTYVEKPVFPVQINNSQIQIGQNWTIICPLQEGHNYHVYCYGAWVNTSSAAKTDYDIYVYDPQGNLESSHTEAAGLPEHLGTATNDAFFTPSHSGNYSFVIRNDPRESQGAQAATFMIIENVACDQWFSCSVEGKDGNGLSSFKTCWAYEFVTNASKVELYIKVPDTLDMYEARLYLMNNELSPSINSVPLAYEPWLYGNQSGSGGGYNFENEAYRGVAYASCEYMGQDMHIEYTSSDSGPKLYHLVLIGEDGSGEIELMMKSQFETPSLMQVNATRKVYPNVPTQMSFTSNGTQLEEAQITYTTDDWAVSNTIDMEVDNQTCSVTLPGQSAGTLVEYRVEAGDVLKNILNATGSYMVKAQPILDISLAKSNVTVGENITISGFLAPSGNNSKVNVLCYSSDGKSSNSTSCTVYLNGTFTASFTPNRSGTWFVRATAPETDTAYICESQELAVTVLEPPIYVKYSMFIIGGLVAASAAGGVVYFIKFRGK